MPRQPFALLVAFAASLALAGAPSSALAQSAGKPALKGMDGATVRALAQKLGGADAQGVLEGLAAAAAAGPTGARVAPVIEAMLVRGSTVAITRAAIEALGAIGARSSSAAIRPYIRHRVEDVRRAAARALALTGGPEAIAAFKEGLRGADAEVRSLSARGLGNLGAREALPELFLALEHDVPEAAAAIGEACVGDECDMLISRLGKESLAVMTSGLDALLFRKASLPEEERSRLIGRIRALGTPDASKYLAGLAGRSAAQASAGGGK